jgi:hypothetical protein
MGAGGNEPKDSKVPEGNWKANFGIIFGLSCAAALAPAHPSLPSFFVLLSP